MIPGGDLRLSVRWQDICQARIAATAAPTVGSSESNLAGLFPRRQTLTNDAIRALRTETAGGTVLSRHKNRRYSAVPWAKQQPRRDQKRKSIAFRPHDRFHCLADRTATPLYQKERLNPPPRRLSAHPLPRRQSRAIPRQRHAIDQLGQQRWSLGKRPYGAFKASRAIERPCWASRRSYR